MEGRAIARPNAAVKAATASADALPSMEGRAIARPNPHLLRRAWTRHEPFNGGPSNRSAKPGQPTPAASTPSESLQWRAEQSLGQTKNEIVAMAGADVVSFNGGPSNRSAKPTVFRHLPMELNVPSMEGRAIARPNKGPCGVAEPETLPSMEGRAIARPNMASDDPRVLDCWPPSMEGRAIARPNQPRDVVSLPSTSNLQWRAEQSLGQTHEAGPRYRLPVGPSMEGRAIARPNGGVWCWFLVLVCLQWRAEQSLGQTARLI